MKKLKLNFKAIAAGLVTGIVNGVFGGGGGMVAVPLLERLTKLDTKTAHATAIAVILPLTAAASAVYAISGSVDWRALMFVAPALSIGSALGAHYTGKIKSVWIDRAFAVLMCAAGGFMLAGT